MESIKEKNIPFIIISSGSSGKEVISLSQNYSFIKEVIIFCGNYEYNKHYINDYPNYVKKVFTSIKSIYEYLKTIYNNESNEKNCFKERKKFIFSSDDIKMEHQIQQCPVITAIEYDKLYFIIHKAYSHFFGDINNIKEGPEFNENNLEKIMYYLQQNDTLKEEKNIKNLNDLIFKFMSFFDIKDNNTFVEQAIRYYTGEGYFCYFFNKLMRNFEKGLISYAYFMGPFLFALNKYVKENTSFALSKDTTLYRIIQCSKTDFYLYKLNLGHIICFPSLTSTSSKPIKFQPTKLALKANNINNNLIKIKMIFTYKHEKGNISPGIIIEDKKGHDNKPLTKYNENEVILFLLLLLELLK